MNATKIVKDYCFREGITVVELANRCGINRATMARALARRPAPRIAKKIADVVGVAAVDIWGLPSQDAT